MISVYKTYFFSLFIFLFYACQMTKENTVMIKKTKECHKEELNFQAKCTECLKHKSAWNKKKKNCVRYKTIEGFQDLQLKKK